MDLVFCVEGLEDGLQPTPSQLDSATNEARKYWYSLADEAIAHLGNGNPLETIIAQDILCKVPALPSRQLGLYEVLVSDSGTKAILTAASSTMRPTETERCSALGITKEVQSALLIGVQSPIACHLTGVRFGQLGVNGRDGRKLPNFTGILSLAWAYILSRRLIELQQQQGAEVSYTGSTASWQHHDVIDRRTEDASSIEIDIGKVDESTARWWAAILAPGQGWKVSVLKKEGEVYYSPWSLSLDKGADFTVVWQDVGSHALASAICSPPSSQTALRLLAEFCSLHDSKEQFFAAFFAALTFPTHKQLDATATIELPLPIVAQSQVVPPSEKQSLNEYFSLSNDIPFFISLSCNHSIVMSSLCGSFWEPNIPCNLVSPWLHPVLEEIPKASKISEKPGRYHEIIALMCGKRRPRLSALWIGAAISGLVPRVLEFVRGGTPPLDPNGFAWTGSPHSFMDLPGLGPYFPRDISGNNYIRRVDAWRLLYLPVLEDDGLYYNSLPFSPWPPVGKTVEKNCVLRIRAHESCPRHRLAYAHWTWQLQDGSCLNDVGFSPDDTAHCQQTSHVQSQRNGSLQYPNIPLSLSQDASREASLEIFRWVLANHEGRPPEPIYNDEWIAGCDESDECYVEAADSSSGTNPPDDSGPCLQGQDIHDNLISAPGSQVMEWINNNA